MEEEIKNKYTPSDGFADELSTWRPIDEVERLNKLQTPTENIKTGWEEITYTSEVGILVNHHYFTVYDEDGLHSCDQLTFEIYGQLVKLGRVYGDK